MSRTRSLAWRWIALGICLGVLLTGGAGWAGELLNPSEEFPRAWSDTAKRLGDDSLYLLTSPLRLTGEQAIVIGAVGAGVGGLFFLDWDIRKEIQRGRDDAVDDAARTLSQLGSAATLFGLNAGAIVVGEGIRQYNGSTRLLDTALLSAEAQLLTLGLTEGLAHAIGRSRPREANDPFHFELGHSSFPSSHASQAFAVAAVLADRYDQPVPTIAYGLAGLVGLARLARDRHWSSDVVAGALLGWGIGKTLSARHSKPHRHLDFFPFADPQSKSYGIIVTGEF